MYRIYIVSESGMGFSQSHRAFAHNFSLEQTYALAIFSQAARGSDK